MRFIELTDIFDSRTIHVNVNSIAILSSTDCMIGGVYVKGCNVTYNIGSSVSSITVEGTVEQIILRINDHIELPILPRKEIVLKNFNDFLERGAFEELRKAYDSQKKESSKICEDYNYLLKTHMISPDPKSTFAGLRRIQQSEKIYPGDKIINRRKDFEIQDVNWSWIGKYCENEKVVFRRYKFEVGESVIVIKYHTDRDSSSSIVEEVLPAIHESDLCYKVQGILRPIPHHFLIPATPSPQETPPCNGNGKDQKTEE